MERPENGKAPPIAATTTPAFFAHSTEDQSRATWQPLRQHLENTAALAGAYASRFDAGEFGYLGGLLHDLGKYTTRFQRRLTGEGGRVDHSAAGAKVVAQTLPGPSGRMLAFCIAGHHAGLANGRDIGERTRSLQNRLADEFGTDLPALCPAWEAEISLLTNPTLPHLHSPRRDRSNFQFAFLTRMLFSCLVDADYQDTEAFYAQASGKEIRRGDHPSLTSLRNRLNEHLGTLNGDGPVNRRRGEILAHVRTMAETTPGLFSLTVPTGGGKTLASLAFALDHAIRHGHERIIYVIPFTSIVEQNAAVFRRAFGDLGDSAVLEHHSNFMDDSARAPESRDKLRLAMENWDAPIVVTTSVQFFESLYAHRPSRCRKLHNIANSVVILDEAQTLPLKLLRPCVATIDELALNYRCSVVLCTATQPALNERDETERSFSGGLRDVRELAAEPMALHEDFRRVTVRHLGALYDETLTERLREYEQILCIVNNRLHARRLYETIANEPGATHLTTLMCARHRRRVLDGVRASLCAGEPCRLVATSLVEAGVDLDFPRVLRAEAGLHSIAQAAGRCNREGRRDTAGSEVSIFNAPDWRPPPELEQFAQAAREVMRHHDDPLSLAAIEHYFRLLYWQQESGSDSGLDAYTLLPRLKRAGLDVPFESIAQDFRMIESGQQPIIIPWDDEARKAMRELPYVERAGRLARRLQPYTVQVPRKAFQALLASGAVQYGNPDRFAEQFPLLVNEDLYDERIGLQWDDPTFVAAEKLIL